MLTKKNFEASISIGLTKLYMPPINCVFEIRAGPYLLRGDVTESDWLHSIGPRDNPRLKHATNRKAEVVLTIVLTVRDGDSAIRVMFETIKNLVVSALLVTSFVDKCVDGIFSTEWKIVPFNTPPVRILVVLVAMNVEATEEFSEALGSICLL